VAKRRTALHENLEKRILPKFTGRVLPFDMVCTDAYAEVIATARKAGSGIETADACDKSRPSGCGQHPNRWPETLLSRFCR